MGNFFRQRREAMSKSQIDIAAAIGVTRQSVINWEKGRAFPRRKMLRKIAKAYGVEVGTLAQAAAAK